MALYNFFCSTCNKVIKKILPKVKLIHCPKCGNETKRIDNPNIVVKEVIDNGLQTRRVERISEEPQLIEQREHDSIKRKTKNTL